MEKNNEANNESEEIIFTNKEHASMKQSKTNKIPEDANQ